MSIPRDLLNQARLLARKERQRPQQASLRRAVSTAYYALFHFLGEESAKRIVGAGTADKPMRDFSRRAIAHSRLRDVANEFTKETPKAVMSPFWRPGSDPLGIIGDPDFEAIAVNLAALQQRRHAADYDFAFAFTRQEALDACDKAQDAMDAWGRLKAAKPEALRLFALAILLWPGLSGR